MVGIRNKKCIKAFIKKQTNNKMKIDLNCNLLDLEGQEVENTNAGKLVAQTLVQGTKGDALKFWDWAVALNKGEVLDLDSSDQETFKNFVKESEVITIFAKAQILNKLKKD